METNDRVNTSPSFVGINGEAYVLFGSKDDKIYIHGFDSQSSNYKYIHYYDEGDEDRLTENWKKPRIDHNFNKEKEYLNLLRKEKKVIDIV